MPGGEVNDYLINIFVHPTIPTAVSMLSDHHNGSLILDFYFDIHSNLKVTGAGTYSPSIDVNTTYSYSGLDIEGEPDRALCLCVDPDIPTPNDG
jgi:hypothetical protein